MHPYNTGGGGAAYFELLRDFVLWSSFFEASARAAPRVLSVTPQPAYAVSAWSQGDCMRLQATPRVCYMGAAAHSGFMGWQ